MKCQKCGAEIAEGKMYCESCGNEIQIVPDFEPEVEQTIHQAMDHIRRDVFSKEEKEPSSDVQEKSLMEKASLSNKHYFRWIVLLLILSFFILLAVWWYMTFTADYQVLRGNYYFQRQEYEEALEHYEKAQTLEPENSEITMHLANCFLEMDRMAGYEASLTKVVQNEDAAPQQRSLAYKMLANLYLEKEEYQKIHSLMKNCRDENILKTFGKYCSVSPVLSYEDGEYKGIVPLKIQCSGKGSIYYTTDGTDPTVDSKIYQSTIFLDEGDHIIKAIYVNEFGVVSDIVTGRYTIKF